MLSAPPEQPAERGLKVRHQLCKYQPGAVSCLPLRGLQGKVEGQVSGVQTSAQSRQLPLRGLQNVPKFGRKPCQERSFSGKETCCLLLWKDSFVGCRQLPLSSLQKGALKVRQ